LGTRYSGSSGCRSSNDGPRCIHCNTFDGVGSGAHFAIRPASLGRTHPIFHVPIAPGT
jgi:hypothetical protein